MIATHNQPTSKNNLSPESNKRIKKLHPISQSFLPSRLIIHAPQAGINPIVDAAGYLFTLLGKLKYLSDYPHPLNRLQQELTQEINLFQETIQANGCHHEFIMVCRYLICATFDDIILNTTWGTQNGWEAYSLLSSFNQDTDHHEKFFMVLDRAIKEPAFYIDLMELIYICLSIGYKGPYRSTEHNQYQLEQITNTLYKHIQNHRGQFSKSLSPLPFKGQKITAKHSPAASPSLLITFFVTASVMMTIFIGLGYLMETISNEAFNNILQINRVVSQETLQS
ncbi:MAG: hypothetical protein A3F12_05980 [Gammaproteobacteria bacterium RIFCSPHIGHO2_12_FULL_38_14]|nr:MAG: hypothetical protein A3F12_05980 [Gammaproteobacteria bacterium RIFCSPHIGHO2_12_FULL_38_14]